MKRFAFAMSILLLLGAGCGSSATVAPTSTAPAATTPAATSESLTTIPASSSKSVSDTATTTTTTTSAVTTEIVVPPAAEPEPLAIAMTSGNFFFDPATITASPGQKVSISFTDNEGTHTFVIDEIGLKKTITTGTVVVFTAPTAPGSYPYYCDIGAHRKLGMEGVLIVK